MYNIITLTLSVYFSIQEKGEQKIYFRNSKFLYRISFQSTNYFWVTLLIHGLLPMMTLKSPFLLLTFNLFLYSNLCFLLLPNVSIYMDWKFHLSTISFFHIFIPPFFALSCKKQHQLPCCSKQYGQCHLLVLSPFINHIQSTSNSTDPTSKI